MSRVSGTYSVAEIKDGSDGNELKDDEKKKIIVSLKANMLRVIAAVKSFVKMSGDFAFYLWTSGFALCAFLKASGTATWVSSQRHSHQKLITRPFSPLWVGREHKMF